MPFGWSKSKRRTHGKVLAGEPIRLLGKGSSVLSVDPVKDKYETLVAHMHQDLQLDVFMKSTKFLLSSTFPRRSLSVTISS